MPVLTPTEKRNLRAALAAYCETAEQHQAAWTYSQARPFSYGKPEGPCDCDCSGYVGRIFQWAAKEAGVKIADPLGGTWNGYGWTGSLENWLRAHAGTVTTQGYLVGDLALFGPGGHAYTSDSHVIVCRKAGSAESSLWSSNGEESAPEPTRLLTSRRHPLIGVWRHPALL
jgi:hypothetical protein